MLEKDNFADLAHFQHSVLEMRQVLVLELISPVIEMCTPFSIMAFIELLMILKMATRFINRNHKETDNVISSGRLHLKR